MVIDREELDETMKRHRERMDNMTPQEKEVYDELIDFYKTQEESLRRQMDELQKQLNAINWRRYEFILNFGGWRKKIDGREKKSDTHINQSYD